MGLPFTVYFKNGRVMAATSSIQIKQQVIEILDREFGKSSENNVYQNSKRSRVK